MWVQVDEEVSLARPKVPFGFNVGYVEDFTDGLDVAGRGG